MRRYLISLAACLAFAGWVVADPFPAVRTQKINDRVYALLGPIDVPNKQNGGYMNNSLVVIGNTGVILVDSGAHRAVGDPEGHKYPARAEAQGVAMQGPRNSRASTTAHGLQAAGQP
ncbi:MAG: hypothetical protein M0Z99_28600 [Betaproteobacteria bacterium]|nr:hypothetical protein [Betaproteobacteria bacterium]